MQGSSRGSLATARNRLAELAAAADLPQLADDLFAVGQLLAGQTQLRRTLGDASVPAEVKAKLVERVLGGKIGAHALTVVSEAAGLRWSNPFDLVDAVNSLAAQATFQEAEAAGTLDEVEDQLFRFARTVEREPALRAALADPQLPTERKGQLVEALLQGKAEPTAVRIIRAAALSPHRRRPIERVLDGYAELSAEIRQRIVARVTFAREPQDGQLERLAAALGRAYGRAYGREMGLQVEIDPTVLGGVVVRVNDEVLDASIARRLERVRRELGGGAAAS